MNEHRLWTALVNVRPDDGYKFEDLVDIEDDGTKTEFSGAWVDIIVKADEFIDAYNLVMMGMMEKNFVVVDVAHLTDYNQYKDNYEVSEDHTVAEDLLNNSTYLFCIVGSFSPYNDNEEA